MRKILSDSFVTDTEVYNELYTLLVNSTQQKYGSYLSIVWHLSKELFAYLVLPDICGLSILYKRRNKYNILKDHHVLMIDVLKVHS